jgi:hypothetical protein
MESFESIKELERIKGIGQINISQNRTVYHNLIGLE